MRKIVIITAIYILNWLNGNTQNIYFISGHPFRNISTQFPSIVYKYQGDTLASKLQISNEDLQLEFVKVYPDQGIVSAMTCEYKTEVNQETLCIIHTNRPDTVYRIKIKFPKNMKCNHTNLIGLNDNEVFECFECFDKNNMQKPMNERTVKEYCLNVYNFSKKELTPDDYRNVIIIGSPASAIEGWDYIQLYSNAKNGKLILPVTPDTLKCPILSYELPDSLQLKKEKLLAMLVNNNNYSVIVVDRKSSSISELGESVLYIYNKINNKWYVFKIKGDNDSMRGFGNWIAGSVVSNNVKLIFNEKGQLKDKIEYNRISPGKEKRRQEGTKYGTYFDMRTGFYYYPGILYLLNINTQKYIEWNTGQGDSEILLVQDEIVYYRVNDEIYKANIINGEKLGQSELLIKDERVPDIHWTFITEN
jgi:hypothetical protein